MTYDDLHSMFAYSKRTGRLTWRVAHRGRGGFTVVGADVGFVGDAGYRRTTLSGRDYLIHRIIWCMVTGSWPDFALDHRNGIRTDNRWTNLREAPGSINQENRRAAHHNTTSRLIGAWPASCGGKWRSAIKYDGSVHFLGYFPTAMDAHLAYLKAKRKFHAGCTI